MQYLVILERIVNYTRIFFYPYSLALIPTWMNNYIHNNVGDSTVWNLGMDNFLNKYRMNHKYYGENLDQSYIENLSLPNPSSIKFTFVVPFF